MSVDGGGIHGNYSKTESDDDESQNSQERRGISSNNNATKITEQVTTPEEIRDGKKTAISKRKQLQIDETEREQIIDETVTRVKDVFLQSGFFETADLIKQHLQEFKQMKQGETPKQGKNLDKQLGTMNLDETSVSEITIYRHAVRDETQNNKSVEEILIDLPGKGKRGSSSSEELINTSDELDAEANVELMVHNFIAENRPRLLKPPPVHTSEGNHNKYVNDDQVPSTSCEVTPEDVHSQEDRADRLVREAEQAKAKIFQTPGKNLGQGGGTNAKVANIDRERILVHSMMVDDDYLPLAAHLDEGIKQKIANGEYVDFSKLLPRDRVLQEEESKLQLIIKNGQTFWVPLHEGKHTINNFQKWEQAFRVYSDIYTRQHPGRASELIQYNHIISTISLQFSWDNVYDYDKDFRLHLERHPHQNWSVILQQAWTMRLKDRLTHGNQGGAGAGASRNFNNANHNKRLADPCRRFNRGKYTYGNLCRYDHRCQYCAKYRHLITTCRKLAAEQNGSSSIKNDTGATAAPAGPGNTLLNNGQPTNHNQEKKKNN